MSNFREEEIKGYINIDGKKVTVLKMGVKRIRRYYSVIDDTIMDQLNHEILFLERYAEYLKKVVGIEDFSEYNG